MKKLLAILLLVIILTGFQDKKKPSRFTGEIKYSLVNDNWAYKQDVTLFIENGYLVAKKYGEKRYNPAVKSKK